MVLQVTQPLALSPQPVASPVIPLPWGSVALSCVRALPRWVLTRRGVHSLLALLWGSLVTAGVCAGPLPSLYRHSYSHRKTAARTQTQGRRHSSHVAAPRHEPGTLRDTARAGLRNSTLPHRPARTPLWQGLALSRLSPWPRSRPLGPATGPAPWHNWAHPWAPRDRDAAGCSASTEHSELTTALQSLCTVVKYLLSLQVTLKPIN